METLDFALQAFVESLDSGEGDAVSVYPRDSCVGFAYGECGLKSLRVWSDMPDVRRLK